MTFSHSRQGEDRPKAKGERNCGTVTFEIHADTELYQVFVCHCLICLKHTGSSGIAVVLADKEQCWPTVAVRGGNCERSVS